MTSNTEHRFAPYVRILGKGKTGSRSLNFDEARDAMGMILRDEVEDVQLGAFLMLLRVKEESAAELAGFAQALRDTVALEPEPGLQLDWPSYAGKRRHRPWYLLAALALADSGISVLMHGAAGHTEGRVYSEPVLTELGIAAAQSVDHAREGLQTANFAYLPLQVLSPRLQQIIDFRALFGLRSPVHSLCRLLNPLAAKATVQSVFHPAYADSHQQAGQLLGHRYAAVIKGDGGEMEVRPGAKTRVHALQNGKPCQFDWPGSLPLGSAADEVDLDSATLLRVWRSDSEHEYGLAAILDTLSLCLKALQPELDRDTARDAAEQCWLQRNKTRL